MAPTGENGYQLPFSESGITFWNRIRVSGITR